MYLNDYQRKMREGASRNDSHQNKTTAEKSKKALDLDFNSYSHVKAVNNYTPYKTEQRTGMYDPIN